MDINRRKFMEISSLAAGSLGMGWLQEHPFKHSTPTEFNVPILATNWGFRGSYDDFCAQSKADGYDGIEVWLPRESVQQDALFKAIEKHQLSFGLLAAGGSADFAKHKEEFTQSVKKAVSKKPLFVNCHSGRDYFTFEQNKTLIDFTVDLAGTSGVPIYHETHRGRILFAAHVTRKFLEEIPGLRLTLDISHWCNVHESLLADQAATVALALERTDHVHSRVGHQESPQISDPKAPEWEAAMNAHFGWWDTIVKNKIESGSGLTMTTEFGPPNYMPALPHTQQPIVDLWKTNVYMKDLWKERYGV